MMMMTNNNDTGYTVYNTGIVTKAAKGFCLATFPVLTSVFVAPSFIRDTYKVASSWNKAMKAKSNVLGNQYQTTNNNMSFFNNWF